MQDTQKCVALKDTFCVAPKTCCQMQGPQVAEPLYPSQAPDPLARAKAPAPWSAARSTAAPWARSRHQTEAHGSDTPSCFDEKGACKGKKPERGKEGLGKLEPIGHPESENRNRIKVPYSGNPLGTKTESFERRMSSSAA